MPNHQAAFFFAFATGNAAALHSQIGTFTVPGELRTFHQDCAQPFVSFEGASALALATGLVVAGADSAPRADVLMTGEMAHIHTSFREQILLAPCAGSHHTGFLHQRNSDFLQAR